MPKYKELKKAIDAACSAATKLDAGDAAQDIRVSLDRAKSRLVNLENELAAKEKAEEKDE